MPKCFAIIPASGSGLRFGSAVKKQFLTLAGERIIDRTIKKFVACGFFDEVVVTVSKEEISGDFPKGIRLAEGGASRAESVYKGFLSLNAAEGDVVLVHDAVRPLVSVNLIRLVRDGAKEKGAVLPILAVTDTIKEIRDGKVVRTLDRSALGAVQTPQAFRWELLKKAYSQSVLAFDWTDEAGLVEKCGIDVFTVPGEKENLKITTPEDLKWAEKLLRSS